MNWAVNIDAVWYRSEFDSPEEVNAKKVATALDLYEKYRAACQEPQIQAAGTVSPLVHANPFVKR